MTLSNLMKWVFSSVFPKWSYDKEKRTRIYKFWEEFYIYDKGHIDNQPYEENANKRYKEGVIALLREFREVHKGGEENRVVADPKELYNLQLKIENLTMHFDEESIFHSTTNILKILIDPEKESARDFLRTKLTSEEDLALIAEFGQ